MTSRTPVGVHPRPPQRTVSSSTLPVQRQPHQQRAVSQQQFFPASPARRDAHAAATADPNSNPNPNPADPLQVRHAATPRRVGSKLRLELSNNDLSTASTSAVSSPRAPTPSRMVPMPDAFEEGGTSPALSRASRDTDNLPLPMPKRRGPQPHATRTPSHPKATASSAAPAPVAKKDARPKAWSIELPTDAPRLPSSNPPKFQNRDPFSRGLFSGHADFFPWNGNHYEDDWSVEAVQKGTWDRGTQTETATARLAISPAIKQKSNLTALSTIFMRVLNQRRHRGQVTAPSTFKPPPRVTLTDTKREVWMKDLANPAISLRRLSRTIPHGIRGRTLLDQCLNKNVPTERAVWLAKCVGANEIRAFKRKGATGAFAMGGESKWIRDWTVFVEQFIDAVVSAFNEADWKMRVTYAIRLATNLYSEQLLDRDHYLDWIVSGLEHSPQSRIPMWLLIAQICWADLLGSRKYGRRLVYALLNHLTIIHNDLDRDILIQLSSQLATLLLSLLQNHSDSFVCPSLWPKVRQALEACLPTDDKTARYAYDHVDFRNGRISVAHAVAPLAAGQHLVRLLDSTFRNRIERDLSARCWATSDDKVQVVRKTVEWATSFHRPGRARVYIAANLVRAWAAIRINATSVILDHMDTISARDETRKQMAYRLVTELVRSGHFSVSQYIQWLIARGGCREASEVDSQQSPCATRLLVNLPLGSLTEEQRRDRGNLLRRAANYSVAEEADDMCNAIRAVDHTLGLVSPMDDEHGAARKPMALRKLVRKVVDSSHALQSSVTGHLRDELLRKGPNGKAKGSLLSGGVFMSIRTLLEAVGDFSVLLDVIKACSQSPNPEVLASCVDTVNLNLQIFSAIAGGGVDDMFNLLMARLRAMVRERGLGARPLLAALARLAQRMPGREEVAKQLAHDLNQSDRNTAIDACSPVSDNTVSPGQNSADGEVSEQMDRLLASGTSIDHPTMNRLFRYILTRLDAGWTKLDEGRRVYASLLSRLRIFDTQYFDKLMGDWVSSYVRGMKERQPLSALFPLLVITHCLPISSLMPSGSPAVLSEQAPCPTTTTTTTTAAFGSANYYQELLRLVVMRLPAGTGLGPEEEYRFRICQQLARWNHHQGFLVLLRNAVLEYTGLGGSWSLTAGVTAQPLDDAEYQSEILESLRPLIVTNLAMVTEVLAVKSMGPEAAKVMHVMMSKLLVPQELEEASPSFDEVLGSANELTMPFCQIKLNFDLSLARQGGEQGQGGLSQFELFAKAMDRSLEAQNMTWTSMLPCLTEDITQHLKNQARARFLELMPSAKSGRVVEAATNGHSIRLAKNLLSVVQAIVAGQAAPKSSPLSQVLVDKLTELVEIVAARDEERARLRWVVLEEWLPALLRFITLHGVCAEPVNNSSVNLSIQGKTMVPTNHEARARIILTLCRLLVELDAGPEVPEGLGGPPGLGGSGGIGGIGGLRGLAQHVLDTALLLVDALPDELRIHAAKNVLVLPGAIISGATAGANTSSDPRLYYLLSAPRPGARDCLVMAHRDKTTMPHAAYREMGAMLGIGPFAQPRYSPFALRRWEMLSEPMPTVGENDTSLSLSLFEAIKIQ